MNDWPGPVRPPTVEDMDPVERDQTVTIASDLGGSVVSIPFLTADQAAHITDQQTGDSHGQEG